jgi:Na+-translocating ferredoxin:NAD+ oxidoreductase subunit C
MLSSLLRPRKTFPHGVHPPELKDETASKPIRRLPFPDQMIIPLSQHTGAPSKPVVREGQEVVRGEPIAEAGGFVSVPMHAPATGIVDKIDLARAANGSMTAAIYIKLYPAASQEVLYGAPVDIDAMTPKQLIDAVQATGVVGLGGAAFPTHVKMVLPEGKSVDTVIANGCECEPYITTDHRVMIEYPDDIIMGMRIVMRAMGAQRGIIGIEDNKPDAAAALRSRLREDLPITVELLPTKYPQGAEKMLTKALLGREIPSRGLPFDVGAAVFNVATLAQIGENLPYQHGLIERVITVTGPGVSRPGNYLMPLGAPLEFVLHHAGLKSRDCEVVFGGPMMGTSVAFLDVPITKGVTGVLVLDSDKTAPEAPEYPCIKCGLCLQACPMHLNPSQLGLLARKHEYDVMASKYHLMDCFECGSCSYICPSGIPLVHYFRIAKAIVREREAKT